MFFCLRLALSLGVVLLAFLFSAITHPETESTRRAGEKYRRGLAQGGLEVAAEPRRWAVGEASHWRRTS